MPIAFRTLNTLALFMLMSFIFSAEKTGISHGPMLGAVTADTAAIWLRTHTSLELTVLVTELDTPNKTINKTLTTVKESDFTVIARFDGLKNDTRYSYEVRAGESISKGSFTTSGTKLNDKTIRMVFGYGYNHSENKMPDDASIFTRMAERNANLVLFLGDFPYTSKGAQAEVRAGSKKLREVPGFNLLTRSTPTCGIYDDHDFGPNDCDGTHPHADEALAAFIEYWPNPSYGLPEDKGNYCSLVMGDVEFFLLDGRYPSRMSEKTMLGATQYKWLCDGLSQSNSRYKVLVSGTQFGRVKKDCWAGEFYVGERDKLFSYINDNKISGVIGISGDIHRSDIYKLPIGQELFFYDFTPGALSRKHRAPPKKLPPEMLHSYGNLDDSNMFGEIEFKPASNGEVSLIYRSISGTRGLIYEHKLSPQDLGIK